MSSGTSSLPSQTRDRYLSRLFKRYEVSLGSGSSLPISGMYTGSVDAGMVVDTADYFAAYVLTVLHPWHVLNYV